MGCCGAYPSHESILRGSDVSLRVPRSEIQITQQNSGRNRTDRDQRQKNPKQAAGDSPLPDGRWPAFGGIQRIAIPIAHLNAC